jgi:uncharacterized protein YfbU (UPF0304 family)
MKHWNKYYTFIACWRGKYENLSLRATPEGFMVFNATFHNISVTSWWSVLLVEETGVPRENCQPVTSHWNKYYTFIACWRGKYENLSLRATPEGNMIFVGE